MLYYEQTMNKFRVLVVDDEPRIIKFLVVRLRAAGYEVLTADSGAQALEQVVTREPDLVVLDVVMPGMDGFETLIQLRIISSVPVIILSAKEASTERIKGLELGADDYLIKPFNPDELVARIEAVKRRLTLSRDRTTLGNISLGDMTLNQQKHLIVIDGKEVPLAKTEWLLMGELSRNAGKLLLYEDLLTRIWGPEYRDDIQILRTWVSRLRDKIEKVSGNKRIIRTVSKTGYIIDLSASDEESDC